MAEPLGMVIRKLHVESFGCVQDATVELTSLTVFVGPNDSGKSTLLRALAMLAEAAALPDGWRSVFPERESLIAQTFLGRGDVVRFGIAGQLGTVPFDYEVEVSAAQGYSAVRTERFQAGPYSIERANGKFSFSAPGGTPLQRDQMDGVLPLLHGKCLAELRANAGAEVAGHIEAAGRLSRAVQSIQLYSLRPEFLRDPTPPKASMSSQGHGLSTAVADLLLRDRDTMERVEKALASAMGHVRRIAVTQTPARQNGLLYELELVTKAGARIPSPMISDGVLLYLGYLYLALGAKPASALLIEEPETGIHFGLLRSVMQLFRDLASGAFGGAPTQILLTTHSPMLLNLVEPEEIRIVQRGEDGATRVSRFTDAPELDKLLDYQGPGEIWVNEGEGYLTRASAGSS